MRQITLKDNEKLLISIQSSHGKDSLFVFFLDSNKFSELVLPRVEKVTLPESTRKDEE